MKIRLQALLGGALLLTVILLVVYRDQLPRHGTLELPDGTYRGHFFRSVPYGYGEFTSSTPPRPSYRGYWKNGLYQGRGLLTYASGKQMNGNFRNGVPHGPFQVTEPNGTLRTVQYHEDEPWKGR